MSNVTINVYQDNRKASKSGLYSVVLKIYSEGATRFFPVIHLGQRLRLTEADFKSSYHAVKPKNEHREIKISIEACYKKANDIINRLDPFNFETFEIEYTGKSGNRNDLISLYDQIIAENEKDERIKNAHSYRCSRNSLLDYFSYKSGRVVNAISYREITPQLLKDYQRFMTDIELRKDGKLVKKKASISTVGAYTRALRAVFNRAIDSKLIHNDLYPFGKSKQKFLTPAGRKIKKALTKEQVQQFYQMDLSGNPKAFKARDFWLLSYVCNGMQFKDIAFLKYKDMDGQFFSFIRQKTKNTTINNQTPIVVPITPHVTYMIETYGNARKPENYIFPIITDEMDAKEKTNAIGNFTRFVSQNLQSVAKDMGLTVSIANMVARHTFATSIIRSGQSIEYAQKAMGHQSKRTTDTYFAGFENAEMLKVNNQLLDFE